MTLKKYILRSYHKMFREFPFVSYHKTMNNNVKLLHKKIGKLSLIFRQDKKKFYLKINKIH
jgi:hypothetical protein